MTTPRMVLNVGPHGSSVDLSTGREVCQWTIWRPAPKQVELAERYATRITSVVEEACRRMGLA